MGAFWDNIKYSLGISPAPARSSTGPQPNASAAQQAAGAGTAPAAAAPPPRPAPVVRAQVVVNPALAGVLNAEFYPVGTRADRLVGKPPPTPLVDGVLNEDQHGWQSFKDGVLNSGAYRWAPPFPRVLNADGYRWKTH